MSLMICVYHKTFGKAEIFIIIIKLLAEKNMSTKILLLLLYLTVFQCWKVRFLFNSPAEFLDQIGQRVLIHFL